jgi:formylglycine-generating enzyme required for sulfatase activity
VILPLVALLAEPPCPADMVLVEGVHHEEVQRLCIRYEKGRCWSFQPGLVLYEPGHTPVRACVDRHEWPNEAGERPVVMAKFTEAEESCKSAGKRLCTEAEWELACEGPRMQPWPYGWAQDAEACNSVKTYRPYDEQKLVSGDAAVRAAEVARLWQGEPSGSRPRCVSPFGVADMVGNVEEWVVTSRPEWPYRSGLKGGFWSKAWAGCRGTNERHAPGFRFYEIGFRCCKDPA